MRFLYLLLTWGTCAAAIGQQFPLHVPIEASGVAVFAGPDASHYPVTELSVGDVVEIYRLDPGDWCAIRPPADSFCLVPREAVRVHDEVQGIGEIVQEGTKCWVGTHLGAVEQPMWQVKLHVGEMVQLLGGPHPAAPDSAAGDQPLDGWLHIAPPNGEFRWIPLTAFSAESQQRILATANGDDERDGEIQLAGGMQEPTPMDRVLQRRRRIRDRSGAELDAEGTSEIKADSPEDFAPISNDERIASQLTPPLDDPTESPAPGSSWRPARRPIIRTSGIESDPRRITVDSPQPFTPDKARNGIPARELPVLSSEIPSDWRWPPQLQAIDLQLSNEVLESPESWELAGLVQSVWEVRSSLSDENDLAVADHLLNKIGRFEQIRGRQLQAGPPAAMPTSAAVARAESSRPVVGLSGNQPVLSERPAAGVVEVAGLASDATQFDAHGWLNELVRNGGQGQTTFVLQDENGKITHLITPAPGVNLHRFVKAKVGLVGQRGFHRQFNLDHVTAERVVRLDNVQR